MSDKWSGFDLYYISCSYSEGMNQFLFLVMQIQVSEQQTILVSHFHITPCDALQKKSAQALSVFAIRAGGNNTDDHCVMVSGYVWLKISGS